MICISRTSLTSTGTFAPAAAQLRAGYADGAVLQALCNAPSSLLHYSGRLYIADTGNCVLRGIDLGTTLRTRNDTACEPCVNKPSDSLSVYTGPANYSDGYTDCPWAYQPPCPVGIYGSSSAIVCQASPAWSTSLNSNSQQLQRCKCRNGTLTAAGTCLAPSPNNTSLPPRCIPLAPCTPKAQPNHSL